MLMDPEDPLNSWCPQNCGRCFQLCSTGGTTNVKLFSSAVLKKVFLKRNVYTTIITQNNMDFKPECLKRSFAGSYCQFADFLYSLN